MGCVKSIRALCCLLLMVMLPCSAFADYLLNATYRTNRYGPFTSVAEACLAEVSIPQIPQNFTTYDWNSVFKAYNCRCKSNPKNICGFAMPVCSGGSFDHDKHACTSTAAPACPLGQRWDNDLRACSALMACPSGHIMIGGVCTATIFAPPPLAPPPPALAYDAFKAAGMCNAVEQALETRGNPINASWGNKCQVEVINANSHLPHVMIYNSYGNPSAASAPYWGYRHGMRLHLADDGKSLTAMRSDGKGYVFVKKNTDWVGPADLPARLLEETTADGVRAGWRYFSANDDTEQYSAEGLLLKIVDRKGVAENIIRWSPKYFSVITSHWDHYIYIVNDQGRLTYSFRPFYDQGTRYSYNATGNLNKITYADDASKTFLYENASFPYALTGIIDENGKRYATWQYDEQGRAVSSEHANGVDKVTLSYSGTGTTSVTYANGATETLTFGSYYQVPLLKTKSQLCVGSCASVPTETYGFDSIGNRTSHKDFGGTETRYTYDSRRRETSRIEAYGTSQARTTTTNWHTTLHLPLKISEPNRTIDFKYDANGNLLEKTITAGAVVRKWSWTYGDYGLTLTSTDPNGKISKYEYVGGYLSKITNPLNQVTEIKFDPFHGKPTVIIDPNGLITRFSYTARGWLKKREIGAAITTYDYDKVGQLTKVTFPDGRFVSYTYDAAHRLTDIADSLGNKIHYTLDLMGNKLKEEIYDPSGALAAAMQAVDQSRQSPLPNPADAA